MKKIALLGSTGSIGQNALEAIALYPDAFQVVALAARSSRDLLFRQAERFRPELIALEDEAGAGLLAAELGEIRVVGGQEGVLEVASYDSAELVLSAITGGAGLMPTYAAVAAGKDLALANKEALVMAGELLMPLAQENQTKILPVDSEHSALHQCLEGHSTSEVRRLWLTASGGPFRQYTRQQLERVTPDEALAHPTWDMGAKITVDSATLMNKGLEVIEAHHLFAMEADQISVVIHPQSIIHSLVEFVDGNLLAQLSATDMKLPILYALTYPERWENPSGALDPRELGSLHLQAPDLDRFPCLSLAYQALNEGGTTPVVLNAANEVAVEAFLEQEIGFLEIPRVIAKTMEKHSSQPVENLEQLLELDRWAREAAHKIIEGK